MAATDRYNAADALLAPNLVGERARRIAVVDGSHACTYGELSERVARFANLLRDRDIAPGQRLLMCLEDSIDFPVCFLGALRAGVIPVPLNTLLTTKDYAYIVADSEATGVVVSARLLATWAAVLEASPQLVLWVAGDADLQTSLTRALQRSRTAQFIAPTRRDDVAFWLYTSGTTGNPKGVIHRHGDLEFTATSYARHVLAIAGDDVVFSAAKLFFAYGLGNALTFPLSVGATAVLRAGRPTPPLIKAVFEQHRPTIFGGVPTLYAMLLASGALPPRDGLRVCISAGEALPEIILQRWRDVMDMDILDGIGTTEMLHIFISNRLGQVAPGSSGYCVPGYEVRLVGDDGAPVGEGEVANLEVRGASAAVGYWKLPELSQATFGSGWVRTGDKYLRRPSGELVYNGRSDDLLKVGGIYVSPLEVENALLAHPAVVEAAVVGAPDVDRLIKPKAFVVVKADPTPELAEELIMHVRHRLADYKRPRWVEFVGELPKTATGKIQRFKLR